MKTTGAKKRRRQWRTTDDHSFDDHMDNWIQLMLDVAMKAKKKGIQKDWMDAFGDIVRGLYEPTRSHISVPPKNPL